MRNEYDFSQSRDNPYRSESNAQSDMSAKRARDTSVDSPATSNSDWGDAFATRSSTELRAKVTDLAERSNAQFNISSGIPMQPRYQVFVSSTFRDLREERQAALEAILELGHFPAGMEAFPAADATPWELIRSIISDSDYYVLIVGGRYGSTGPEGISYTEMEFNLAVELKKPILAFLHGAPDDIPMGKGELNADARKQLEEFRAKVSERLCKGWKSKDELKSAVLLGLIHLIRTKPAFGWVRNEGLQNHELLQRLAALQSRHDQLQAEAEELRSKITSDTGTTGFQRLDELYAFAFTIMGESTVHSTEISWSDLFLGLADDMLVPTSEYRLRSKIGRTVAENLTQAQLEQFTRHFGGGNAAQKFAHLSGKLSADDEALRATLRQLMANGLIAPELVLRQEEDIQGRPRTSMDRCWALTTLGRKKYLEQRAFR